MDHEQMKDAMRAQDEELEKEINDELNSNEETNSQSEFVDATQFNEVNNDTEEEESVETSSELHGAAADLLVHGDEETRRVEIEKRNIDFLNQSWANMAEDAQAEQNLLKELEGALPEKQVNDDDGFQVVKSKGKTTKKKTIAIRSSTRGKAGNFKPFK